MADSNKIVINGKEIANLEDIPEPFRKFLVDENKNGIPDAMEGFFNLAVSSLKNPAQPVVIDARGGGFLFRIPPESRQRVLNALERLKELKQQMGTPQTFSVSGVHPSPSAERPMDYDRIYRTLSQPAGQSRSYLLLAVLLGIVVVIGVLAVGAFFLMPK